MSTKLNTITTQYRKFNSNQVLTESQLNEFLDFFEDQDHLSRIGLSGVGIVCGFKITYNISSPKTITISQGYGVTTDGDLLTLQNPSTDKADEGDSSLKSIDLSSKTYTHFRKYESDKVMYKPFFYSGEDQIELWELQAAEELPEGDTSFSELDLFDDLSDKVVLLYLENYSKEGDLCTALNCDNQGIEQVANLKVLLVSTENAKYITGFDAIYNEHDWYQSYLALPEISAKRVILNSSNTKTLSLLKQNYYNAIKSDLTLTDLKLGYDVIMAKFDRPLISSGITSLFNFSISAVPLDFQYRYDVLKDLIDTYNDIKELLLHINVHCCPNIGSFPKHLMLGKLVEVKEYPSLRHRFYKSPIVGHEERNYRKVISLLDRASELVKKYLDINKGNEIKITPSQAHGELEHKAIPFYYEVDGNLLKHWSFEKSVNLSQTYNLSYHTSNLANTPSIQQPLLYNIDGHSFYRIEGHQGKVYREALDQILKLKETYGLGFDVKLLSIDASKQNINIDDYKCEFEDLKVIQKAWITEQECILSALTKFFSGFSTKDIGINIKDAEYVGKAIAFPVVKKESKEKNIPLEVSKMDYAYRKNVVQDNVVEDDNTVGKIMKIALDNNENGSINDIKNAALALVDQQVKTEEWNANSDIRDLVIYDSIELMTSAYILTKNLPRDLLDINAVNIATYNQSVESICALAKRMKGRYQKIALDNITKQISSMQINQLSMICCSGEKLKILLEEIEKRKQDILIQLQLAEFVKKHPGLEHKAGVEPGGTFVMVYLTENTSDKDIYKRVTMELEFLNQPSSQKGDKGALQLWDERLSTEFMFVTTFKSIVLRRFNEVVPVGKSLEETVENFADFLNNIWRRAGALASCAAKATGTTLTIIITDKLVRKKENFIQFENKKIVGTADKIFFDSNYLINTNVVLKNLVVADFALPYMCCSDCASINFIVPKEPVFLSLPEPFICLEKETEPIPFTISPKDGVVKAVVSDGKDGGVTKDASGMYVFNPLSVDKSLYGTSIHFTVNNEETNCEITVYDKTELAVITDVQYNANITQATVLFKVLGEISKDITFTWDLGDGTTSNEKPVEGIFSFVYNLPVNVSNSVKPSLTISNGFCQSEIKIPELIFKDPVNVNLRIKEKACIDSKSATLVNIPFTNLSPQDGKIKLADTTLTGIKVDNTTLIITPNKFKAFNKSIAFTVNGLATTAAITVFPLIEVDISPDPGSFNWVDSQLHHSYVFGAKLPQNVNVANLSFEWIIDQKVVGTEKTLRYNFLIEKGENTFEVTLNVTEDNGCTASKNTRVAINYPEFKITLLNNRINYCINDPKSYKITVSPPIFGTVVEGLGVKSDGQVNNLTPANIGAVDEDTSTLSVDGEPLLTINLHKPAVAAFTPVKDTDKIILKNQSSGEIKTSKWTINNTTKEIVGSKDYIIPLTSNSPKKWVFRLEVTTQYCGSSITSPQEFLIDSESTCIKDTKITIEKDDATLNTIVDISASLKDKILIPTIKLYGEVAANSNDYLNGNKNNKLISLFSSLLDDTSKALLSSIQDAFTLKELSKIYLAQIKLFHNIIHCQEHDTLNKDKDPILTIENGLQLQFRKLKAAGVKFDPDNNLKKYLRSYAQETGIIAYIATFIKTRLIVLIP